MYTKDNGWMGWRMDKDNIVFLMEITMLGHFIEEWDMEKVTMTGKIKVHIRENGVRIKCMDMEHIWIRMGK